MIAVRFQGGEKFQRSPGMNLVHTIFPPSFLFSYISYPQTECTLSATMAHWRDKVEFVDKNLQVVIHDGQHSSSQNCM